MENAVSAADANRKFSQLLQGVRRGRSFVVTSHGRAVAKIAPIEESSNVDAGARTSLLTRLREQPVTKTGRWTRDELYEDAQ
jgi:prevent-host-death family protein